MLVLDAESTPHVNPSDGTNHKTSTRGANPRALEFCLGQPLDATQVSQRLYVAGDTDGVKINRASGQASPAFATMNGPRQVAKLLGEIVTPPSGSTLMSDPLDWPGWKHYQYWKRAGRRWTRSDVPAGADEMLQLVGSPCGEREGDDLRRAAREAIFGFVEAI